MTQETPEEMYERIKTLRYDPYRNANVQSHLSEAFALIEHYRNQAKLLREAMKKAIPDEYPGDVLEQALAATEEGKWL